MAIRKIRANRATREGEYVVIETYSKRWMYVMSGAAMGVLVGTIILDDYSSFVSLLAGSMVGTFYGGEGDTRYVPFADVVEIKKYPFRRVTVVLDDERVKRRGGGLPPRPKDS